MRSSAPVINLLRYFCCNYSLCSALQIGYLIFFQIKSLHIEIIKQDSNWGFNKAEINIIDGLRMECSLVVSTAALLNTNCLKYIIFLDPVGSLVSTLLVSSS